MNEILSEFSKYTNSEKRDVLNKIYDENISNIGFELIEILENEENINLREKILLLLEKQIETGEICFIEKMFESKNPFTRNGAVELLKRHKNYSITKKLIISSDKDVRKFGIDSLKFDESNEAFDIIEGVLKEEQDINIIMTAIEMAGDAGMGKATLLIEEKFIKAESIMLKCVCLEALSKIGCGSLYKKVIEKIENEIENPIMINSILRYISNIDKTDSALLFEKIIGQYSIAIYLKEIVDYLKKMDKIIPERIKSKLLELVPELKYSGEKYEIIKLVYENELGEEAIIKIKEMLNSDDEMIILAGLEILEKNGCKKDIPSIENVKKRSNSASILEAIEDTINKLKRE